MEGLTLIDIILVQLAIVFLPGLIWAQIDARYSAKEKSGQAEFVIRAFLFGISTYAMTYVGYTLFGQSFSPLSFESSGPTRLLLDDFVDEILVSVVVAFVLAIVWMYAATYKLLVRLLIKIRATKKYGDEDVWDFTFNSSQEEIQYVHVRDFTKGTTYSGWVRAYSETGKSRELLLRDVIMFDRQGGNPTEVPLLYLERDGTDIHIEFPFRRSSPGGERRHDNGEQR